MTLHVPAGTFSAVGAEPLLEELLEELLLEPSPPVDELEELLLVFVGVVSSSPQAKKTAVSAKAKGAAAREKGIVDA